MALLSRTKGKVFERRLATILRERWPDAIVRRASQADRAHQSDVYVQGGPAVLAQLWWEAQDARQPTPLVKLEQAERDIGLLFPWRMHPTEPRSIAWHKLGARDIESRLPIVVWHKLGAREIHVTTRLWVVDVIRHGAAHGKAGDVVVTMTLDAWLAVIATSVTA